MDIEKLVYVILLNYCNYDLTIDCINSIKQSSYKNIKTIVVDNASPDGSGKKFLLLPDIKFIQSNSNSGFSAGNNLGIKWAMENNADYVMLLNNDTVIERDMIEKLVLASENEKVAVPKMYYFDKDGTKDCIWYAGGVANLKKCDGQHIGLNESDSKEYSQAQQVSFATGCCVLVPRNIIEKVGYLDESYFMYCEDLDYSIRLNKCDVDIIYEPSAKLWHKVSASSGGEMSKFIVYYIVRNRVYCAKKNGLGIQTIIYIFLETINRIIKGIFGIYYRTYVVAFRAYFDGLLGKMGKNTRF